MTTALRLAFKDIRKNISFVLLFNIQLVLIGVIFLIAFLEIPSIYKLNTHINNLEKRNVTSFKSYYKPSVRLAKTPDNVKQKLIETFDEQQIAFSTINSYSVPEFPDIPAIIVTGAFFDFYPMVNNPQYDAPKAYIGSKINNIPIGTKLTFEGENEMIISVEDTLLPNSHFFDSEFEQDLNKTIIIYAPYKTISDLFESFQDEEIIQNTCFINATDKIIDGFVAEVNKSKIINVLPYSASKLLEISYHDTLLGNLFFVIFFTVALVFSAIGIGINLATTVQNNLPEYTIHYMYGATIKEVAFRIILYMILLFLPFSTILFGLLFFINLGISGIGMGIEYGFIFLIVLAILIIGILIYPLKKLHENNLQLLIRKE